MRFPRRSLSTVNPLFARAIVLVSAFALVIIPACIHRGGAPPVTKSRKGPLERFLLILISIGFSIVLLWVVTPVLRFADYSLHPVPSMAGTFCLALGLWLLYRSHAALATNWSITLETRRNHQLVTCGVYRLVRHPMYLALLLYASGLALVLPNWVAGPSYLVTVAFLVAFRVGPEERMMLEEFGNDYEGYRGRTRYLIPGIW